MAHAIRSGSMADKSKTAYTHSLSFDGGAPRLALITCWPFDALTTGGSERYVVTASLDMPPG